MQHLPLRKFAEDLAVALSADIAENATLDQAINTLVLESSDPEAAITRLIYSDVLQALEGQAGPALFPRTRKLFQALVGSATLSPPAGTGETAVASNWTALLGTLATAAAGIYAAKLQASTQKDLAKLELSKTVPRTPPYVPGDLPAPVPAPSPATVATAPAPTSIPSWVLPIGVAAIGIAAILLTRRR